MISLGIMLIASCVAFGYVKTSVTRDFALLHGGLTEKTQRRTNRLRQHQSQESAESRGLTGGLEIVSDATEHVGWQRIKDDIFRPPGEPTLLAVCTGIGAQICLSVYVSVLLMCIFYSISYLRPLIFWTGIVVLAFCGYINGFMTSRMLKFF